MNLKEKLKWEGHIALRRNSVLENQEEIRSGNAKKFTYYMFVTDAVCFALETYLEGDVRASRSAAQTVVHAIMEYFYGAWREQLPTPDGALDSAYWRKSCLWYDEVMQSLPWACALDDWQAVQRIAEYPIDEAFPQATKVKGETAYGRALICFLRGESREKVVAYIKKVEADKAKRPKLLCAVLRALMDKDGTGFERELLEYLEFFRKREFKRVIDKLVSLDGSTLYHLGRQRGYKVELPAHLADYVIRF